ncbi:MAG: class 1 fructose-bisphosphatase [Nitrososphaerales archaeon]
MTVILLAITSASKKKETRAHFLEEGLSDLERDLAKVYEAIAKTAQSVSRQFPFRLGMTKTLNPFGEQQAELDVFSNEMFSKALLDTARVGWVASEEMSTPLGGYSQTQDFLAVALDPIDGSSNIRTNNPLGSIFGIWRGGLLKKGKDLVGAAFVTYGPMLTITLAANDSVNQYVELNEGDGSGKFAVADKEMKLPQKPEVYGFGGPRAEWIPPVERFVSQLETRGMHLRYGGTLIGDYNNVLQRGGIFSYPALKGKPEGKLRICYETAPVSYLNELAGGRSSNGEISILDIEPKDLTQRSAFYVGNASLIQNLEHEIAAK